MDITNYKQIQKPYLFRDLNNIQWGYGMQKLDNLLYKLHIINKLNSIFIITIITSLLVLYFYYLHNVVFLFSLISISCLVSLIIINIYKNKYVCNETFNFGLLFTYPIDIIFPKYICNNNNIDISDDFYNTKQLTHVIVVNHNYKYNITYLCCKEKDTNKYVKLIIENDFIIPIFDYI